jgi:hypothetical protein
MSSDIFEFWSKIPRGAKIHPADEKVFSRLDPEKHGFQLDCLPGCFDGPLRTAPLVLLYLSPGLDGSEVTAADTDQERDYYFRRWRGNEPLRPNGWVENRIRRFGEWSDLRHKVAVLNIGAYHSTTFNDYSVLAALPSSRVSLEWAQVELFPQAEAGDRIVVCLRASSYWGLDRGQRYGEALFAPHVNRGGYLMKNEHNEDLIKMVRAKIG